MYRCEHWQSDDMNFYRWRFAYVILKKAFESAHYRKAIWDLLRLCRIPTKIGFILTGPY